MKRTQSKRNKGFTLVEIMAVLVIVGMLAAIAAKSFMGQTDKAARTATIATLKTLQEAVQLFRMDTGRYPTDEEGLTPLVEQPSDVENWDSTGYLQTTTLPKDGWNRDFFYMTEPGNGKPFVVISFGKDGEEGGEEGTYDVDLWSTDANQ